MGNIFDSMRSKYNGDKLESKDGNPKECSFLDQPVISTEVKVTSRPTSIFTLKGHKMWVFFRDESSLQLYKGGKKLKTLNLSVKLHNVDINTVTEEAIGCALWNKKIQKINLKDGSCRQMFTAEGLPEGVVLTTDNQVLTYVPFGGDMHRRTYVIVRYTSTGERLKSYNRGQHFWHKTLLILECPITGYVAFLNGLEVIVLDQNLQHLYTHKGQDKVTAALFDTQGHLFIAEYRNIHIADSRTGTILHTLSHESFSDITALATNQNGTLKVGYGREIGNKRSEITGPRRSTFSGHPTKPKAINTNYFIVNVKFRS